MTLVSDNPKRAEMLETNVSQRSYYEQTDGGSVSRSNGFATNLWRKLRLRAHSSISADARRLPYDIHINWMGDLSRKKVLDLGCGTGSPLTGHLALNALEFHALDLSENQVNEVRAKFEHLDNTHFHVADVLSDGFTERGFDVIYAHSVFHHFRYHNDMFDRIEELLAPGGMVLTVDPIQTWLPARIFRSFFRPFQTDANWEFPFGLRTINDIEARFEVCDRIGIFGRAKWAFLVSMFFPGRSNSLGDRLFREDYSTDYARKHALRCLVISYLLRARDTETNSIEPDSTEKGLG